ncbi:uncharacterized protein LOC122384970 [Amphibalanus amphitrite]|uniref:uncharacterized protein LOC122384970 n=1 Tax=Amphibalanus amphitrite TaxID=1232801 RepID=UPI001C926F18|nr:uncharacterized protein LOC122384970 [Amphibalanus amphitrite]
MAGLYPGLDGRLSESSSSTYELPDYGKEHLMWCTEQQFDHVLQQLSPRGLLELIQLLQDAMLLEQATFDSLQQQLDSSAATDQHRHRLSAALCTSQARLTRLCGRSMRCFSQQALRSRQQFQNEGASDSTPDNSRQQNAPVNGSASQTSEHSQQRTPGEAVSSTEHRRQRRPSQGYEPTPPAPQHVPQRRSTISHESTSVSTSKTPTDSHSKYTLYESRRQQPASRSQSLSDLAPKQPQAETGDAFKRNLSFFQRAAHGLNARMSQSAAAAARRTSSVDSDGSISGASSSSDRTASFGSGRFGGVTSPSARVTSEPARAAPIGSGAADGGGALFRAGQRPGGGGAGGSAAPGTSGGGRLGGTAAARIRQSLRSRELRWEEPPRWGADDWEDERPPLFERRSSDTGLVPPPRRPHLQLPVDQRRSCEDLSAFGRPSRPLYSSRVGVRGEGLTRARSCENGLDRSSFSAPPLRTASVSALVTGPNGEQRGQYILRRAPSAEEVLESVKELRVGRRSSLRMERDQQSSSRLPEANYQNVLLSSAFQPTFQSNRSLGTKISIGSSGNPPSRRRGPPETGPGCYQNVWVGPVDPHGPCEVIYDHPANPSRKIRPAEHDQLYENVHWSGAPTYENIALTDGVTPAEVAPEYDVPRKSRVYDTPRAVPTSDGTSRSADTDSDWDEDSLDGDLGGRRDNSPDRDGDGLRGGGHGTHGGGPYRAPGLSVSPLPEQTSLGQTRAPGAGADHRLDQQADQQVDQQADQQLDEQLDEGLGESDGRSHYNEEPGLEVIVEEAEEDYVTTSEEEDEDAEPAASLASMEGSEGIGSAEGDLRSNGSLERCSTLSSSGGHRSLMQDDDPEGPLQKDCSIDIYPETMRQRKHKRRSQTSDDSDSMKSEQTLSASTDPPESRSSPLEGLLPSVKALKSKFERSAGNPSGSIGRRAGRPRPAGDPLALDVLSAALGELSRSGGTHRRPLETVFDKFPLVDERTVKPGIATDVWDPSELLKVLYEVPQPSGRSHSKLRFTNIEGWLEKLPSGMTKATFWNAWKRRYFKAKDGFLYYYQNNVTEKPSLVLRLMGGRVELMDCSSFGTNDGVPQTVFSLYDGVDRFMVVRCARGKEADRWHRALLTHTTDDASATYVQPVRVPPNPVSAQRRVIIDLGSTAVRAGLLLDQPTLPQLFFPAAVVSSGDGRPLAVGSAALRPAARAAGRLWFPVRSAAAGRRRLDVPAAAALVHLALRRLQLSGEVTMVLSVPHGLRSAVTAQLAPLLLEELGVRALAVVEQSEAALAAYGVTTGLVVNVGESTDVVPIIDGAVVPAGVTRLPHGGSALRDQLRPFLLQRRRSLTGSVESLLLRHAFERLCFVSERYEEDVRRCAANPAPFERTLPVSQLLGDSSDWREIELGVGRFQAPESLFSPHIWGLDQPGLHELVHKAIEACPVESRRELLRTVCLSGGVTQLPGLAERLQLELDQLATGPFTPRVHASAYRCHAAYLGAGVLAASDRFQQRAVTRAAWRRHGAAAFDPTTA